MNLPSLPCASLHKVWIPRVKDILLTSAHADRECDSLWMFTSLLSRRSPQLLMKKCYHSPTLRDNLRASISYLCYMWRHHSKSRDISLQYKCQIYVTWYTWRDSTIKFVKKKSRNLTHIAHVLIRWSSNNVDAVCSQWWNKYIRRE